MFDIVFQSVIVFVALTALNRLVFGDSMAVSIMFSLGLLASFWFGRICVMLARKRMRSNRVYGDE